MKSSIPFLFLLFVSIYGNAQHEADIWYFGEYAGIDFSSGSPIPLTDGALNQHEGCATISNKKGELLFYTDGMTIWDSEHSIMKNGTGLLGHPSSTQSGIIVPNPSNENLYYVFTVPFETSSDGLRYSVVDMNLDNGLGVVTEEKNIYLISTTEEKVTAVLHNNGIDFWVITHLWDSQDFYSYLITKDGIQPAVISTTGSYHSGAGSTAHGYMKVSHDGKKIALNIRKISSFELFDFDDETGTVSNPVTFPEIDGLLYGIEFSPDNKLLYLGSYLAESNIYQYDISSNDPETMFQSQAIIGSVSNLHLGALQLGPDNKIYVSKHDNLIGDNYLGVINDPNQLGINCNFVEDGFYLAGKKCIWGLPNFIQSFSNLNFTFDHICLDDLTEFHLYYSTTPDSVLWNFGDPLSGDNNTSTDENPSHSFSSPGDFIVVATAYSAGTSQNATTIITIVDSPDINLGEDLFLCDSTELTLFPGSGYDSYLWQDGSNDSSYLVTESGQYWVRVESECGFDYDTININLGSQFEINLGNDTSFCYGDETLLCPGPDYYSYLWQDGSTDSVFIALIGGTYWVMVSDSNGCIASDTIYIDTYMDFNFNIGSDTTVICDGDYVIYNGPDGYDNYLWQDGSQFPDFIADTSGLYWLEVYNEFNCASRDSAVLLVNKIDEDFLGADTIICNGVDIQLKAPTFYSVYLWSSGETNSAITIDSPGQYWVYVEDSIGCNGIDSINIDFLDNIKIIASDTNICPFDTVELKAPYHLQTYQWNTGQTDSVIEIINVGLYWIEGLTDCGFLRDSIYISEYKNTEFNLGNDTIMCQGTHIILMPGEGFKWYLWNNGSTENNIIVNKEGTYFLDVFDGNCVLSDTIVIEDCNSLYVPNVFTPNNDGYNDYFYAVGDNIDQFQMTIYNRWGVLLKTLHSIDEKWDGTHNNTKCPDGVYYWFAEYLGYGNNGIKIKKTAHGSVSIIGKLK